MSPMRITTLTGASAATSIILLCHILEAAANADLVADSVIRCGNVTVIILWIGFFIAYCRDTITRNSDRRAAELVSSLNRHKADFLVEIKEIVADAAGAALTEVKDVVDDAIGAAMEEAGHREATAARLDMLAGRNGPPPPAQPSGRRGMQIVD